MYIVAENGGSKITQDDVELNIAKRRGENPMADILEHQPHYWTSRTRAQVEAEGYNADYVADELKAQGLTFADEGYTTGPLDEEKAEE